MGLVPQSWSEHVDVTFSVDRSDAVTILDHLRQCDGSFAPALSSRVDLDAYSRKLQQRATRWEAWTGGSLVGLVAAYLNRDNKTGFVTNVSVLSSFHGRGLGRQLLDGCIKDAWAANMNELRLDVSPLAAAAVHLYARAGFRVVSQTATEWTMVIHAPETKS